MAPRKRSRSASESQIANRPVRRRSADGPVSAPRPVPSTREKASPGTRRSARRDIATWVMASIARRWRTRWNDARRAMGHAGTVRPWVRIATPIVGGYLLGSIPTAVIVGRRRHVDLRLVGDRNPGWWNAKEELGRRAALPVLVGDVA